MPSIRKLMTTPIGWLRTIMGEIRAEILAAVILAIAAIIVGAIMKVVGIKVDVEGWLVRALVPIWESLQRGIAWIRFSDVLIPAWEWIILLLCAVLVLSILLWRFLVKPIRARFRARRKSQRTLPALGVRWEFSQPEQESGKITVRGPFCPDCSAALVLQYERGQGGSLVGRKVKDLKCQTCGRVYKLPFSMTEAQMDDAARKAYDSRA